MSYRPELSQYTVAISTSDSPDMPALGLSDAHLRDAMTEIARHLLALGARLIYGGDLRMHGFSELLFELVARHHRDAVEGDNRLGVVNYLAWPVHICMGVTDLEKRTHELSGFAELVCLTLNGMPLTLAERRDLTQRQPTEKEWSTGLTAMRQLVRSQTQARVVLGGRVDQYKGVMPGIAEEVLLSLQNRQPLFLMGGFGGCARDIAQTLGLVLPQTTAPQSWRGQRKFESFGVSDLNNGLTADENATLARTPHVDQAVTLMLSGLLRLAAT